MKNYYLLATVSLLLLMTSFVQGQVDERHALTTFINNSNTKGLVAGESIRISSGHVSSTSGVHHYYLQQHHAGIPIYGAIGSIHFAPNGKLIQKHDQFIGLSEEVVHAKTPEIPALQAIRNASEELGFPIIGEIRRIQEAVGVDQAQIFENKSLNQNEIRARLMYLFTKERSLRLCWNFDLMDPESSDWWDLRVDAETGKILDKNNFTVNCGMAHQHDCTQHDGKKHSETQKERTVLSKSNAVVGGYRVYPYPLISPADGNRQMEFHPDDALASPFGWHDTNGSPGAEFTITQGNNAHAYEDGDNPGFSPDGGVSLVFDFVIDTVYSPGNQSEAAAITNLFYWSNLIHDVMYQYGFTEAAGNFQQNNYGRGGAGNDYVYAEAQDGSGTCNANFSTPSDGFNPRMQMYVCDARDGDLDNVVIVHEYGHGISNRLTGGPGQSACLNNQEQMGEGWSDYLGLIMTIKPGDIGSTPIEVGNWLIGEPLSGDGIRAYPYTTDLTMNPHTYDSIKTAAAPHGVGSVWCAMLWELTWALVDYHGFDSDLYTGTGGNNIALQLVMEGMKLQPCHPGFVDGRDAILLADEMLYGGANKCLIWEAFAKRGLGFSALQGSSASKSDGVQAFDLPSNLTLEFYADKTIAIPGETILYTLEAKNLPFCDSNFSVVQDLAMTATIPSEATYVPGSASHGGSLVGDQVIFPIVANLNAGDSIMRTYSVLVHAPFDPSNNVMADDMESGTQLWETYSTIPAEQWNMDMTNPHGGSNAWFAENYSHTVSQYLELVPAIPISDSTRVKFWHHYNTEFNWDGGVVQYSIDGSNVWMDAESFIIQNGYTGRINNNSATMAYSGDSGGYIESILDFTPLSGQTIRLRFWLSCDYIIGDEGWYIDDVTVEFGNNLFASANFDIDLDAVNVTKSTTTEINTTLCDSLLSLHGNLFSGTYHAGEILSSDGTVVSSSSVVLKAEEEIRLEPNFEVELGGELTASIENCISALNIIRKKKASAAQHNLIDSHQKE